jgi:hypothetical protein
MGWFSKKITKTKYKPTGRLGWYTKNDYPFYFTILFERLYDVNTKSKVKILEVDVRRDCTRTREECLKHASVGDWVSTSAITWETDEQYHIRINQTIPVPPYENHEELRNDDVDFTRHTTNPFIHNFVNQNNNN